MAQMQVFVSHSHQNNGFCAELVEALRRAGADVWYDEQSLHAGQLGPTIERELRARPVFIVVLSPAALASRWVEDETRWAYGLLRQDPSRILLPVLAEQLPDANALWLFLQDFKRIEAPGTQPYPQAEAVTRTLHALQLTLPGEAALPTAPQPAESADDLIMRGSALRAQGKHAEALPLFERATQLDSRSFDAWYHFGYTLDDLGEYDHALSAYDKALTIDPASASTWVCKGVGLNNLKRYEEALAAYDRALALDPNLAAAWTGKGAVLWWLTRYEESVDANDKALAADPTYAQALINKALSLKALGRTREAEAAERRARELGWQG